MEWLKELGRRIEMLLHRERFNADPKAAMDGLDLLIGRFDLVLVERSPGAEIAPTELGWQAKEIRFVLALGGTRLKDRVVHRDVLALGIVLAEAGLEFGCAEAFASVCRTAGGRRGDAALQSTYARTSGDCNHRRREILHEAACTCEPS